MSTVARIAFLLTALGCSAEESDASDASGAATHREDGAAVSLEIGTGETAFAPIPGDATLPMIAGSQGGFHVWLSLQAHGFEGPRLDAEITTEVLSEEGASPGVRTSSVPLTFDPAEDETLEFVGWPAVLDTTTCPLDAIVRLRVRVAESGGTGVIDDDRGPIASDEREIIVDDSEASWLPPSCGAP